MLNSYDSVTNGTLLSIWMCDFSACSLVSELARNKNAFSHKLYITDSIGLFL